MSRLNAAAAMQFYATPPRVTAAIARRLAAGQAGKGREIRLLDPCAGEGVAAATLADALGARSYGIELNEQRAAACRGVLDEVIAGSAMNVRLSREAWGLLYLNPPYDASGDEARRLEHAFLVELTRALAPGGVLVFVIPQRRLARSARYLATHYAELECLRFPDPEYSAFRQVALFARKRTTAARDAALEERVRAWAGEELPPLPDEPPSDARRYAVPALPRADATFAGMGLDPAKAAAEARERGAWALPAVRDRLWPPETSAVRPLMPLRRGHLAMLISAGFVDNRVLRRGGERLLVKGRAYKELVPIESAEPDALVEREVVRTRVTALDLDSGVVTDVGDGEGLARFMDRYGGAVADAVREEYPPVYTAGNRHDWGYDLSRLRRRPKGAQADAIRACAVSLERSGAATLCGAMGTGKTYVAAAAAWYAGARRTIVVCPSHLVRKWAREVERTVPGARGVVVRDVGELEGALRTAGAAPLYVIVSKEMAKLSYAWRPAVVSRRWLDPAGGARERLCCPGCGLEVLDREGTPLGWGEQERRRRSCEWVSSKKGLARGCGGALWVARARPPERGRGGYRFGGSDAPVAGSGVAREGPRRYALADYIRKRLPRAFDAAILDECHQLKARGSAQGIAAAGIASSARRVLALTGTLFGAYSSTLFYLRYRFSRSLAGEFGFSDEGKWISRYGIAETIKKYDGDVSDGAVSRRRLVSTRTVEKPGISHAALLYLVGDSVFVRLEDVERELPPYAEHVRLLPLDEGSGQAEEYRKLASALRAEVKAALAAGSKRLLGAYLQALLSYPDACHRGEVVLDKADGRVIASAAALPEDALYPKERALVELCRREKARGRRVLVYASHTGERDITGRLRGLLAEAGLRARVLGASVRAEGREEWVAARVAEGVDVLITNPRCVETGLDLLAFPTLVFHEIEYGIFTLRQAAKRSWRIGQTEPVEVYYWAYEGTLQADALSLVASKLRWSLLLEGDLGGDGLGAVGGGGENVAIALARSLADQAGIASASVEAMFAQAREARAEAGGYLDEGWTEEAVPQAPALSVAGSGEWTPEVSPEELASLWGRVFGGEEVRAGISSPSTKPAERPEGRAVTWGELAARLPGRAVRRARPAPQGQLGLPGEPEDLAS